MSGPPEGLSWHFRTGDRYITRGAECIRLPDGWFAHCRETRRARGPLSSLEVAMRAAEAMLAAAQRETAG